MITRSNYEHFFLDYHEGRLEENLRAELFAFLEQHPDLKEEFESFALILLEQDAGSVFPDKDSLKKNRIHSGNYQTWLVAYHEGDLDPAQQSELEAYLQQHPAAQAELEEFSNLKIATEPSLGYRNKEQLKRGGKVLAFRTPVYRVAAIAAILILVFVSYRLVFTGVQDTLPQTAQVQPKDNGVSSAKMLNPDAAELNKSLVSTPASKEEKAISLPSSAKGNEAKQQKHSEHFRKKLSDPVMVMPEPLATNQFPSRDANPASVSDPKNRIESLSANQVSTKEINLTADPVFSLEELAELDRIGQTRAKPENGILDLAASGAEKLAAAAGADLDISSEKADGIQKNVYALRVGKFSLRHTGYK